MQSKTQSSNHNSNTHDVRPFWRSPRRIFLNLTVITAVLWLFLSAIVLGQMQIKMTNAILKREGCAFVQQHGVNTQPAEVADTCEAKVLFRANLFGSGGRIYLDDGSPLHLSDNQFVAVSSQGVLPWTTSQRMWAGAWVTLTALLFVAIAALRVVSKRHDNR